MVLPFSSLPFSSAIHFWACSGVDRVTYPNRALEWALATTLADSTYTLRVCIELGPEGVSLLERCPHFRGWYVQASMELGPEDVSLLERCPHFRGWYVQASMELGPEDVSLLEVSSFQRVVCTGFNGVGT